MTLPRVVQIGFNKCATRSLVNLFRGAGHKSMHFRVRQGEREVLAAAVMARNLEAGRPVFHDFEEYVFYSDLELNKPKRRVEGYRMFREIHRDYPDTIFLLNYREEEAWIRSRVKHANGGYVESYRQNQGLPDSDACIAAWREERRQHMSDARAYFADKPGQLVEFDLDTDSAESLCARFPDYGLDPAHWRKVASTRWVRRKRRRARQAERAAG